jgi:hypothetical protein
MKVRNLCKALTLRSVLCSVVLVAATALITTQAMSQDHGAKKDGKGQAGAMNDEMMKKMMELGAPGPQHKKLDVLAGEWNVKSKCWMDPKGEAEEGGGKATFKWVLDGRYLTQEYQGTSAMGPFSGIGYFGYDNAKKEYWALWMDSMSTSTMITPGMADSAGRTFTFRSGSFECPMTGKPTQMKMVLKVESPSKMTYEMYVTQQGTPEYKNMEITYTKS